VAQPIPALAPVTIAVLPARGMAAELDCVMRERAPEFRC